VAAVIEALPTEDFDNILLRRWEPDSSYQYYWEFSRNIETN